MITCNERSLAAYRFVLVFNEIEWKESRNSLDFLDLADHSGTLYEQYKAKHHFDNFRTYQRSWITADVGQNRRFPLDDCRVLFEIFRRPRDVVTPSFFHLSIKSRRPDWIGRNLFLEFVEKKTRRLRSSYLELGESAVHFLNLASLCGFRQWRKSTINGGSTHIDDNIFPRIYPSILKGLYRNKEVHPLLVCELWDLFSLSFKAKCLVLTVIPDVEHLEFVLDVANRTRFNFWGWRHGWLKYLINTFIIQGRCMLALCLLRYGFTDELRSPAYVIGCFYDGLSAHYGDFTTQPGFKQMFRMLFLSLPFPIESPTNLRRTLYRIPTSDQSSVMHLVYGEFVLATRTLQRETLEGLINAYVTCGILPQDPSEDTFPKLSHLCRCAVRKQLGMNYQLPKGIQALGLPTSLEDFLWFGYKERSWREREGVFLLPYTYFA